MLQQLDMSNLFVRAWHPLPVRLRFLLATHGEPSRVNKQTFSACSVNPKHFLWTTLQPVTLQTHDEMAHGTCAPHPPKLWLTAVRQELDAQVAEVTNTRKSEHEAFAFNSASARGREDMKYHVLNMGLNIGITGAQVRSRETNHAVLLAYFRRWAKRHRQLQSLSCARSLLQALELLDVAAQRIERPLSRILDHMFVCVQCCTGGSIRAASFRPETGRCCAV